MQIQMNLSCAAGYHSACQIARRVTEAWAAENLYCAACDSDRITPSPTNHQAIDFRCVRCNAPYQLKAGRAWNERRIPDAGYDAMMAAIQQDRTPNLLVLQYSREWCAQNLLLVPSFFFTASSVQKRKPLGPQARRAGWVGCNILLDAISPDGKLRPIERQLPASRDAVRQQYSTLRPMAALQTSVRGWTLDVLRLVRGLGKPRFTLQEVYAMEDRLRELHPGNLHIRQKIRQRLQVLRDLGILDFCGRGRYALRPNPTASVPIPCAES